MSVTDAEAALAEKKLGNAAYKKKEWETAIEHYSKAIEFDSTNHTFFSNRSACYAGKGDHQNSLSDAESVIQINPTFVKGYTRKALALRQLGREEEAVNTYKTGLEKCGQNDVLAKGLQSAMTSVGKGMLPRQLLTNAMAQDAEVADWYQNDPEFKRRVDCLTTQFPNQVEFQMWLQDDKIKRLLKYAGLNFDGGPENPSAGGNSEPARAAPKQREPTPEPELTPEEIETLERKKEADTLKQKGTALYKKKQFIDALKCYKQASEVCPEEPVYLLNVAAAQLMMGELEACEENCRKALEVSNEFRCDAKWDAKAYARLASVEEKRGDFKKAIAHLEDSLLEVRDPKIKSRMKQMKKKMNAKAKKDLLNPEDALEYKNKGDDAFRNGKWTDAIKFYTESVARNPDNEKVYNNRATAFCKLMAWDPALKDAMKAIALVPTWAKPYLRKAKVEQALQKYHRALATLKLAKVMVETPGDLDMAFIELQTAIGRANNTKDPERQRRALEDPEIQAILKDPVISGLLKSAEADPSEISKAIRTSEHIRDSIEMLAAAGIIQ